MSEEPLEKSQERAQAGETLAELLARAERVIEAAQAGSAGAFDAGLALAWELVRTHESREGGRVLEALIDVHERGTPEQRLEWTRCESARLRDTAQLSESLRVGFDAVALLEEYPELKAAHGARLYNMMGHTLTDVGDLAGALEHLMLAGDLLDDRAPALHRASVRINVGRAHQAMMDWGEAERCYRIAMVLLDEAPVGYLHAIVRNNLAQVYVEKGRVEDAIGILDEAISLCTESSQQRGLAVSLHSLGTTYKALGDLEQAQAYLAQSLGHQRAIGDSFGCALTEVEWARVAGLREDPEAAVEVLRRIQGEWREFMEGEVYRCAVDAEYEIWRSVDAFEEALVALERYREAARLQMNAEGHQLTRALAFRYRVDHLVHDHDRLEERARELEVLTDADPLTGIRNRRALFRDLKVALEAARDAGRAISVVFCDIDHFKKINDEHSHQVGDEVLKRVAVILEDQLRAHDVLGRYGGEEFLFCLPGCDAVRGSEVAERMRNALESADWTDIAPTLAITGSFGLAVHQPDESLDAVIERADKALYAAKAERNTTRIHRATSKTA